MFRFRKLDLTRLMILLVIPAALEVKGGRNGFVQGEYAFLLTLHRLRFFFVKNYHTLFYILLVFLLSLSYLLFLVILKPWKVEKLFGEKISLIFQKYSTPCLIGFLNTIDIVFLVMFIGILIALIITIRLPEKSLYVFNIY